MRAAPFHACFVALGGAVGVSLLRGLWELVQERIAQVLETSHVNRQTWRARSTIKVLVVAVS